MPLKTMEAPSGAQSLQALRVEVNDSGFDFIASIFFIY